MIKENHMIIAHDETADEYTVRFAEGRTDILGKGKTSADAIEDLKSQVEDDEPCERYEPQMSGSTRGLLDD